MRLICAKNYDDMSLKAANIIAAQVSLNPKSVLGLATGSTPIGMIDHAFIESRTEGFADLKAMVEAYTPERVAQICAIDPRDLIAAARLYGRADRAAIVYCLQIPKRKAASPN